MTRLLFATLLLIFSAMTALAEPPARIAPRPLASALDAAGDKRWARAADLAARDGPVAEMLIEWARLRAGRGTLAEVLAFLDAHKDWPGLDRLRNQSLGTLKDASDTQIIAFYQDAPPQTGEDVLRYAAALIAQARRREAEKAVIAAWRSMDLDVKEHTDFLNDFGTILVPHHKARMDMTLWRGLKASAMMLPLVDDDTRALADIRLMPQDGR